MHGSDARDHPRAASVIAKFLPTPSYLSLVIDTPSPSAPWVSDNWARRGVRATPTRLQAAQRRLAFALAELTPTIDNDDEDADDEEIFGWDADQLAKLDELDRKMKAEKKEMEEWEKWEAEQREWRLHAKGGGKAGGSGKAGGPGGRATLAPGAAWDKFVARKSGRVSEIPQMLPLPGKAGKKGKKVAYSVFFSQNF